jgi:hypothetical protein
MALARHGASFGGDSSCTFKFYRSVTWSIRMIQPCTYRNEVYGAPHHTSISFSKAQHRHGLRNSILHEHIILSRVKEIWVRE